MAERLTAEEVLTVLGEVVSKWEQRINDLCHDNTALSLARASGFAKARWELKDAVKTLGVKIVVPPTQVPGIPGAEAVSKDRRTLAEMSTLISVMIHREEPPT